MVTLVTLHLVLTIVKMSVKVEIGKNASESRLKTDPASISTTPKIIKTVLNDLAEDLRGNEPEYANGEMMHELEKSTFENKSIIELKALKRIEKLVPEDFRTGKVPAATVPKASTLKTITFDKNFLLTCLGVKQLKILGLNVFILLIAGLENECPEFIFQDNKHCPIAEVFFTVACINTIGTTLFLICYILHVVEAFSGLPWLFSEYLFYGITATLYLVFSCLIFGYGGFFIVAGIMGLLVSINLFVLSLVKWYKHRRGDLAQARRDDPDGNTVRMMAPNLRFKGHHGKQLIRMWTM